MHITGIWADTCVRRQCYIESEISINNYDKIKNTYLNEGKMYI